MKLEFDLEAPVLLARDLWPPELHGVTHHSAKFATLYCIETVPVVEKI
jgi:hypothetical protein